VDGPMGSGGGRRERNKFIVRGERQTAVENCEPEIEDNETEEFNAVWCHVAAIEADMRLIACPGTELAIAPLASAAEIDAPVFDRQPQAWGRQADSRRAEREVRKRSVAFSRWSQRHGQTLSGAAEALDVSLRTLSRWRRGWHTDRLAIRSRGRPCRCAAPEVRNDVTAFLDDAGPGTGLPALQHHYPQVARAELVELLTTYRGDYRQTHARQQAELHWLRPGSVWAMDFSHPLVAIDGYFSTIFTVRDLASQQQLLWLPVEDETAATAIDALHD